MTYRTIHKPGSYAADYVYIYQDSKCIVTVCDVSFMGETSNVQYTQALRHSHWLSERGNGHVTEPQAHSTGMSDVYPKPLWNKVNIFCQHMKLCLTVTYIKIRYRC